ncbi:MAG TPA: hypothetical protein VK144_06000 [Bacillota bacterium]|nr:hypothetical protein [Bacillota bacterium]
MALLLLLGCQQSKEPQKGHEPQEPVVDYEAGDYHDIGETFSFHHELEPEIEAEITVDDIWIEDATGHEELFQQEDVEMVEESTVTFITFTVRNRNADSISYLFLLPSYMSSTLVPEDINYDYPDNDVYPVIEPHSYEKIDRGTSGQITGAIPTTKYEENGGVFFWNPASRTPEVVFQTPQSKRKDKMGLYDIGEEVYVVSETEDYQLTSTIESIEVEDNPEKPEKELSDSTFLVVHTTLKNRGKLEASMTDAILIPLIGEDLIDAPVSFNSSDGFVDNAWGRDDMLIAPGETIEGTFYLEIEKDQIDDIELYYPDRAMILYPDYWMKINYKPSS